MLFKQNFKLAWCWRRLGAFLPLAHLYDPMPALGQFTGKKPRAHARNMWRGWVHVVDEDKVHGCFKGKHGPKNTASKLPR